MDVITERIQIIDSFRSPLGERKRSVRNRLNYLTGLIVFNSSFLAFCGGATILSIVLPFLGMSPGFEWEEMALPVLFSLTYLLNTPPMLYEFKLLKHLNTLQKEGDHGVNAHQNKELRQIIRKLGKPVDKKFLIIITGVLFAALIQLLSRGFSYWTFFEIPYLLILTYLMYVTLNDYKKLKKNICEAEKKRV